MFKFFYYGLLGISALMIYSWVSLFFLPSGASDAKISNKWNTGAVTLLFCIFAGLVWYFQQSGRPKAAVFTLFGFYGVLVLVLLWAMRNGRWN